MRQEAQGTARHRHITLEVSRWIICSWTKSQMRRFEIFAFTKYTESPRP